MTEHWYRELAKLRGAPGLPEDLWRRVRTGPRMEGAPIPARTRAATIAVALAVSIAALAVAWIVVRPMHREQILSAGSDVLDVPAVGAVAPANLAGGRPVFVVHHDDGTVSVVDGFSTHRPWGLAKVVAWCSTSRTFDDVFHGAKWNEDGDYLVGPAPTGLVTYETTILGDGQVKVGSDIPVAPRGSGGRLEQPGPWCQTSANIVYPAMPTEVFDSPSAVVDTAPDGWVALKGELVATGGGGVELCSVFTTGPECHDGAPVEGIDVSGLFGENPGFVVSGPFIARVEDGSLIDLTRVPEP
jgi:hypothetical protein